MFDLNQFKKLKENNRLEVKQSLHGIPSSIWETYSAFCNSYGGTILLGGESKARNRTILNIFSFVNIGERAGSGYPLILNATKEGNYPTPELFDEFNPDVTKLTVFIKKDTL